MKAVIINCTLDNQGENEMVLVVFVVLLLSFGVFRLEESVCGPFTDLHIYAILWLGVSFFPYLLLLMK